MKAVIMAGGLGTRIHPLTTSLAKPMLPLLNLPLMLHTIELLKQHGFCELIVLLHHRPSQVQKYFGDGRRFGVRIEYFTAATDLGTAGSVTLARERLDKTFLLISGDILTDFDLSGIIARHSTRGGHASMVLSRTEDPCSFGVVTIDRRERVRRFVEKPSPKEVFSNLINTGIYILEPQVLDLIPPGTAHDWGRDVFPDLLKYDLPFNGLLADGYWQDLGTPNAYLSACQDIYAGKVKLFHPAFSAAATDLRAITALDQTPSSQHRGDTVFFSPDCRLHHSTHLANVVIGRNCIIEPGCHLENSILWDNVHLRRNSKVYGAVLGNNVSVGPEVLIEAGAIIADHARIKAKAHIAAGTLVRPQHDIPPTTVSSLGDG